MTIYYVGSGGNNANAGTSWAARRLSLTSIETLLAAGDTVRVGPGTYREGLTTGVAGSAGNPITYVADEGGTLTDGVGGEVRITGSDDDVSGTRSVALTIAHAYRTFQGFHIDYTSGVAVQITAGDHITIDQCVIQDAAGLISIAGAGITDVTIKRCILLNTSVTHIAFSHSSTISNTNHLVENCIIVNGAGNSGVNIARIGGITVRNCYIAGCGVGVRVTVSPAVGQTNNVNDCIITGCSNGLQATATSDLTEDYNSITRCITARNTVNTGAHSNTINPLMERPLLTLGLMLWKFGYLSSVSGLASIAGTGVASDDLYGLTRAGTSSWGPIQYEAGKRPVNAFRRSRVRGGR